MVSSNFVHFISLLILSPASYRQVYWRIINANIIVKGLNIKFVICIFFIFIFPIRFGLGKIIHVHSDSTIQWAIDTALDGDTVLVEPGIYKENIDFRGKDIVVGSLFLIQKDTSYISGTIIDGNNNGSVVTFANSEDSTTILCGFTIRNGSGTYTNPYSDSYYVYVGGGIYCNNSSPNFNNLIIKENSVDHWGGGIFLTNTKSILENLTIVNNSGRSGGGIENWINAHTIIKDVIIENNSASYSGGGITVLESNLQLINVDINSNFAVIGGGCYIVDSSPLFENTIIAYNSTLDYGMGGGVFCSNFGSIFDNPTFRNVLIVHNKSGYGAGIFCENAIIPHLINVTITKNIAIYEGGAINGFGFLIMNSILWDNKPDEIYRYGTDNSIRVCYSDVQSGWTGEGNIDANPKFVNTSNNNYHLSNVSPCQEGGVDSLEIDDVWYYAPSTDIEGDIRPNPVNSNPDMGAYESKSEGPTHAKKEITKTPQKSELFQNYPNPFNPYTIIKYQTVKSGYTTLKIFNLAGQEIETLVNCFKPIGEYRVKWTAEGLPSGIYFYRLQTGDFSVTKKLILQK